MGAETRVGWGRRALALFEVFALVALMGLQLAAASGAAAGRTNGERPDVERDCSETEGGESQADQVAPDEGRDPSTEACREDSESTAGADDEADGDEAHNHEADEAHDHHADREPDEAEDVQTDESGNDESDEADGHESDDHEADEADGHESREANDHEADNHEPEESGDHAAGEAEQREQEPADDAEQVDVGDHPNDAEPGEGSRAVPEGEPSGRAETSPDQGGQATDTTDAEAAPESPNPTDEAGGPSGDVHQDANSQSGGSTGPQSGGSGSAGPEPDVGAGRSGPRDPGSEQEAPDSEPAPVAAAAAISGYNLAGSFSTAALLDALPSARVLSARKRVPEAVPFIIAGPASWTDTWGAPRFGPGSLARRHEGQDVFCRYGDPVLASERGYVEFDEGGLGGKVVRLHQTDGSYWYYAHLSAWNTRDFASGDRVVPGDVIGYCGNSGNAVGSPPHVHFGLYGSNQGAINPMMYLVRWLRTAERRPVLEPLGGRDSNRDASGELALNRSSEAILEQRLPRLEGTGDAFGDSSARLESARGNQLPTPSRAPIEAALSFAAIAMLLLWGGLSARGNFSSA